jgi:type IV pilus assembly protein PilV
MSRSTNEMQGQISMTFLTVSKKQQGFSLIEVLIALIIMSVGMLGIAGLYVQSLQAGRTSMFRHQAVALAGDVADRIRANPTAGISYADATGADNSCVDTGVDCDVAGMALHDVFLWKQQAGESLPGSAVTGGGDVTVTFDDTVVPPLYTITVSWEEPGITALDAAPSYVITIPVNPF